MKKGTTSYTTHSVSGSGTTSYTITNLNLGTRYRVRVASNGPLGLSGYCCQGNGKWVTTYNSESTFKGAFVMVQRLMAKISLMFSVTVNAIIHFWLERELLLLEYQCCINNVTA